VMNFNLLPDKGKKKRNQYWYTCIILGIVGWISLTPLMAGGDSDSTCGFLLCCSSLVFAISALTTPNDNKQLVVIQQPAQYVPVQQQPIIQQVRTPQQKAPSAPTKTKGMWVQEAQNLELARNWEGAAEAYEKAGLYAEAGRIRKEHLENTQPVVQIGKVGDTILHDSVMISEDSEKLE